MNLMTSKFMRGESKNMDIKNIAVIDAFLKAKNDYDSAAFVTCFSKDAVVEDEGQEISGKAAIQKWIEDSNAKYHDTVTAKKIVERGNKTVLTAQVAGNFDGSPVFLDFYFVINEGKISRLSIQLTDK